MNTQYITLDLSKRTGNQQVIIAQGDAAGTTIVATINDHGTKLAEGGIDAKFCISLPDRQHYVVDDNCIYENGVVTYVCNEDYIAAVAGYTDNAYFELHKGSVVVSTERFSIDILPSAYDGMGPGESYDSRIEAAIQALYEAIEHAASLVPRITNEEIDAIINA